jgi:DNA-directed RNA polymerase specialized sigma24 family protein
LVQRVAIIMFRHHALVLQGSELSYLSAVSRREAGHLVRAGRRKLEIAHSEPPEVSCVSEVEERLSAQRSLQRLQALFESMPAPTRDTWLCHVIDGNPCSVVAATLHVPLGTVKSRLRKAWSAVLECCQIRHPQVRA